MLNAFSAPGRFYKGNIHTHSTKSDGKKSPEEVVAAYQTRGYDFISLTDHFLPESHFRLGAEGFIRVTDTTALRSTDFTTILGAEVHAPALQTGDLWHLVAAGLPLDFAPLAEGETGLDIARRAYDAGAFVGIAHPAWYTLTIAETLPFLPYAHAIEVYNHACSIVGRQDSWYFADELYAMGYRPTAYAADDAHRVDSLTGYQDAFGGWVQVKSESLDPDALVAALKAGNYYSSTGPEIEDISWDGEVLHIASSPVAAYLVTGAGARSGFQFGEHLTEGSFPLRTESGRDAAWAERTYFRVTAIAADRTRAWSQPFFL